MYGPGLFWTELIVVFGTDVGFLLCTSVVVIRSFFAGNRVV